MLYIIDLVNDNCQYFMRPWFFIQILHLESILSVICDPERVTNQGKLHICSVHFVVTCNWWKHIFQLPVFEKFPCLCPRQKNTNTFWEYVCPKQIKFLWCIWDFPIFLACFLLNLTLWLQQDHKHLLSADSQKFPITCPLWLQNVGGTAGAWNAYTILPSNLRT